MRRLRNRLVAGVLAVAVPVIGVVAVLLTTEATAALTDAARDLEVAEARRVAAEVDRWIFERRADLRSLAAVVAIRPDWATTLGRVQSATSAFSAVEVTDPSGKVLGVAPPDARIDPRGEAWFAVAAAGQAVITTRAEQQGTFRWVIAEPITTTDRQPLGVAFGVVNAGVLAPVVGASSNDGREAFLVDDARRLVVTSRRDPISARLVDRPVDTRDARLSLSGGTGATIGGDYRGRRVVAGVAPIASAHWGVVVKQEARVALASVARLRRLAIGVAGGAVAVLAVFAMLFARGEEWRVAERLRDAGAE
jgi:hypothetical protein